MRLLSNLHVKGKPAVLPDRAIRRQSHYFIYRPRMRQPQGFEGLIVVVILKLTVSNLSIARNIRAILTKFPVGTFKW